MVDGDGSDIHMFAVVGPGDRGVVGGIARLSERDYKLPSQRLLRRLVDALDERVEEVILVLLCGLSGAGFHKRLHRDRRPADRNRVARGIDETECVEAVVGAVVETRRHRMASDDLHRTSGCRIFRKKLFHFDWIRFSRRRVSLKGDQLIAEGLRRVYHEYRNVIYA